MRYTNCAEWFGLLIQCLSSSSTRCGVLYTHYCSCISPQFSLGIQYLMSQQVGSCMHGVQLMGTGKYSAACGVFLKLLFFLKTWILTLEKDHIVSIGPFLYPLIIISIYWIYLFFNTLKKNCICSNIPGNS